MLARFWVFAAAVAARFGASVDGVFEAAWLLRMPGSINHRVPDEPVQAEPGGTVTGRRASRDRVTRDPSGVGAGRMTPATAQPGGGRRLLPVGMCVKGPSGVLMCRVVVVCPRSCRLGPQGEVSRCLRDDCEA